MDAPPRVLASRIREVASAAVPAEAAGAPPPPARTGPAGPAPLQPVLEAAWQRERSVEKAEPSPPALEPSVPVQNATAAVPVIEPPEKPPAADTGIGGIGPEIGVAETDSGSGSGASGRVVDLATVSVDSSGAIMPLSQGAPGSLPVLEAIQAFLAEERAIMRRRFRALVLASAAIIVAVTSASAWIGWLLIGRMRGEVETVRGEVNSAHERAVYVQQQATSTLSSVSAAAHTLRKDIMTEKQALSTFRSGVDSRLDSYAGELGELRELLGMLRMESASLKEELASVRTSAVARAESEQARQPPPQPEFIEAKIVSRAGGTPATWRLPLPE